MYKWDREELLGLLETERGKVSKLCEATSIDYFRQTARPSDMTISLLSADGPPLKSLQGSHLC